MPNVIAQITTQLPQPSLPQAVQTAGDTLRSLVEANAYVEQRSLLTNITESFASTNTGPVVGVSRIFDAYGELGQETIIGGNSYSANQGWDAAGRRTGLSVANFGFGFGFRADGLMTSVSGQGGSGSYAYDTGGLIQSRSFSPRVTTINARDGAGRPTSITTTVNGVSTLTENLSFTPDGLLATHSIGRPDFTDNRAYTYASQSRRLTQEITGITSGTNWTNGYVYDNGAAAGPGVMTSSGQTVGTNVEWNGGTDAFSRIGMATNSVAQRQAYGFLNGPATMTALLDGNPTPVTTVGTNDNYEWWAQLQLAPGPHQLVVNALNWSGYYTASATNTFTNNAADHVVNAYAGNGEITNRVWISSNGQTNATEKLSFDARDRLHSVTRLDSNSNGYSWNAAYDGYGRRLSTTTTYITNGVILTNMVKSIGQFYDPQVQFLELGEYDSGVTTWKFYGPDANGVYGGMQGAGGLEAVVNGPRTASAVVNDARGNALALYNVSESSLVWFPSRPTSYGAVPGYAPLPLTDGAKIAQSSAWHHKWPDATGYYSLGNRILDPISHTWLSADPLGHDSDPSLFTFCGGDPVNAFDADGMCANSTYNGYVSDSSAYILNLLGLNSTQPSMGEMQLATYLEQQYWSFQGPGAWAGGGKWEDDFAHNFLGITTLSDALNNYSSINLNPYGGASGGSSGPSFADIAFNWGAMKQDVATWNQGDFRSGWGAAIKVTSGVKLTADAFGAVANVLTLGELGLAKAGVTKGITQLVEEAAEGASIRWGPLTGSGPLGDAVANTFRGGSYTESVLNGEITLYRSYGGTAGELGSYWTRTPPTGPLQATMDSALNPAWGNTAQNVSMIRVPSGTTIYEGFAAPQGGLLGGGSQVYIPKVNPNWLVHP